LRDFSGVGMADEQQPVVCHDEPFFVPLSFGRDVAPNVFFVTPGGDG